MQGQAIRLIYHMVWFSGLVYISVYLYTFQIRRNNFSKIEYWHEDRSSQTVYRDTCVLQGTPWETTGQLQERLCGTLQKPLRSLQPVF